MTEDQEADPTLVRNQPALRTSSGRIWLVAGGVFLVLCAIPLTLVLMSPGAARPMAWITLIATMLLYAGMIAVRLGAADHARRLRWLAVLMLGMAVVALAGLTVCTMIAWSRVP
ncbi:hypothetical protein DY023_14860 [Microbacterium bovistercoris]|uniref:Uncharacterized protein n=1 Tax=Microbacterium bovistercoris TaxID=2293570 RepID=A0A371NRB9_9MICO|nr:hypothetical protein [Microbacterium bovistercoris]REJ04185.1 hypothetical protein DY023_14860 [Microbacterium bovistercoris]